MDYLINAWKVNLSPFLMNFWDSLFFWRTFTLGFLTVISVLIIVPRFRKCLISSLLKPQRLDHDKDIFKRSNDVMDEVALLQLLDDLEISNLCVLTSIYRLDELCSFFLYEGNQYLTPKLRKTSRKFIYLLDILSNFIGTHFYPNPPGASKACLCPELRARMPLDQDATSRFQTLQNELHGHITTVRETYRRYRLLAKKTLYI